MTHQQDPTLVRVPSNSDFFLPQVPFILSPSLHPSFDLTALPDGSRRTSGSAGEASDTSVLE